MNWAGVIGSVIRKIRPRYSREARIEIADDTVATWPMRQPVQAAMSVPPQTADLRRC
jgi:hypothetical protein